MKGRVPIAISQVHQQLQEVWGLDPTEVGSHHSRARRLPARDAKPLLTDGVQGLPLKYQQIPVPGGRLAWGARAGLLVSTGRSQLWLRPPLSSQLPLPPCGLLLEGSELGPGVGLNLCDQPPPPSVVERGLGEQTLTSGKALF